MIVSVAIIIFSALLFGYWFRYSCVLILRARPTEDHSGAVIETAGLRVLEVQTALNSSLSADFDGLRASLEADYRWVVRGLNAAAALPVDFTPIEKWMLEVDFQMMRAWYALTRTLSKEQARKALLEMSTIVTVFANSLGAIDEVESEA